MKRKNNILILSLVLISVLISADFEAMDIKVYDSETGGSLLWSHTTEVTVVDGSIVPDPLQLVRRHSFEEEIVYVEIFLDGDRYGSGRIAVSTSLRRESEPMDEMDMGLIIGETGNDIAVRSDRMVVGAGDPNETVTVEGAMSMEKQVSPPTSSTGYGKIFVNDTDNELYYIRDDGTSEILSVDDGGSGGIVSIEGSDRDSAMVGRIRLEPGSGTEITETMEGDTGLIVVRFTGDCGSGCSSPPDAPSFIDGNSLACSGEPGTSYSTLPISNATYYRWTFPSGSSILTGSGTNSIHIIFGNTDGDVCVSALNECGESSSFCKAVTINRPTSPGSISGPTLVCEDETGISYNIATVPDATDYSWTVPPGASIVSGSSTPTITVNFATSPGEVCVRTENSCGISDPECLAVEMTATPSTPGTISGLSDVCSGATGVTYSISEVSEATDYTWSVPSGATIVSGDGTNTIDVDFGSSSGDVCVNASSICGTSADRCLSVNILYSPSITANPSDATVDEGDAASFSVTATGDGLTYQWRQSTDGGSSWSNIGTGGSSYTTGSTTESMDGYRYRCIVTGTCSPADTSAAATLTVNAGLYDFESHTFTNCGATGRTGPSLSQCRSEYTTSWDEDDAYFNMSTTGIQEWTVPADGTYRITVLGAQGGGSSSGLGAEIIGDFSLTEGEILKILVGQEGTALTSSRYDFSGGGGSFVTDISNNPLIIAGGGGGAEISGAGSNGQTGTSGHDGTGSYGYNGTGGTSGNGGSYSNQTTDGGAGLLTDGGSGNPSPAPQAFVDGGEGGSNSWATPSAVGGFGGGGSSSRNSTSYHGAGGGGGYSGGGSSYGNDSNLPIAGGGGSYNSGTSQSNTSGVNTGHGSVTIEKL
ncbi:MAG: hypothetical protein ACLFSQ_01735 [Candidatus Zixiibacteriota bacterium]